MNYFIAFLVLAGLVNALTGRVPNILTGAFFLGYFVFAYLSGVSLQEIGIHFLVFLGAMVLFGTLFYFEITEGGIAKLVPVAAMWLDLYQALLFVVICIGLGLLLSLISRVTQHFIFVTIGQQFPAVIAVVGIAVSIAWM